MHRSTQPLKEKQLTQTNQTHEDPTAPDGGDVGDVETAGETTAADTITGPAETRPVGDGTTAPVEGDGKRATDAGG